MKTTARGLFLRGSARESEEHNSQPGLLKSFSYGEDLPIPSARVAFNPSSI